MERRDSMPIGKLSDVFCVEKHWHVVCNFHVNHLVTLNGKMYKHAQESIIKTLLLFSIEYRLLS